MKDNLFNKKNIKKGSFIFDENVAAVFDNMLNRSIPFYEEIQRMIIELTNYYAKDNSNIYDLGCSTATTICKISKEIKTKNTSIIGIDYSDPILKKAAIKIQKHKIKHQIILIKDDLNNLSKIENASVVILNLTLQFVKTKNRLKLIKNIYSGLKKGGCLIIVDKIKINDTQFNNLFNKLYHDFKRRNGYNNREIEGKKIALKNVLIPNISNKTVEMLKKNKFNNIEEFFRWYCFSGIIALKK